MLTERESEEGRGGREKEREERGEGSVRGVYVITPVLSDGEVLSGRWEGRKVGGREGKKKGEGVWREKRENEKRKERPKENERVTVRRAISAPADTPFLFWLCDGFRCQKCQNDLNLPAVMLCDECDPQIFSENCDFEMISDGSLSELRPIRGLRWRDADESALSLSLPLSFSFMIFFKTSAPT